MQGIVLKNRLRCTFSLNHSHLIMAWWKYFSITDDSGLEGNA